MTRAKGDGSLIAVVGISCRLPHAPDVEAYWRLLAEGRGAISELPRERFELAGLAPGGLLDEEPGMRFGGFLDGVDRFDPSFFGIAPREAASMDPQQRLALELAWEALEDGGIAASSIRGEAAGVFLGAIAGDYAGLVDRQGPDAVGRYTVIGLYRSIIANRISYALGLAGPSLTVDAAQSASLVAVHLACESLRRGESKLALAGGVHLNLDPRSALGAARIGGLSPDGRCFTFDARANGFVRGEGGGLVLLKPLADARADGDHVYCVVRGSAVNNDGGGPTLTTPSQAAQEAVLETAYRRAGVKRSEVQYVELHGSGTPVGDPIEAAALGAVLGCGRPGAEPLAVGSAKTNLGHLEGAAGIAGMIKTALAIDRRRIPASLNFEHPSPEIPLAQLGLRVQDGLAGWPDPARPLLAGVSSFGVGGTNCHVVLAEDFPVNQEKSIKTKTTPDEPGDVGLGRGPLLLSAASRPALRAQAARLSAHLKGKSALDLADLGFSLATTRSHLRHRAAVMPGDRDRALADLDALAGGDDGEGALTGIAASEGSPVLLFPGQGAQWRGMGIELAESSSVFREYLGECEAALAPHIDFSVRDVLRGAKGSASFERLDVLQPALFAVMTSLARLWGRCGVTPAATVGHSQGEVAAAYACGGLSLEDAAFVAAVRSRLIEERAGPVAMISVALPPAEVEPLLTSFGDRLALAARNGPRAVIVAGERLALDALLELCADRDVRARDVAGGTFPSHTPFVEPMRAEVIEALRGIRPRSGSVPFYSTVTGGLLDTSELDPEYWYRNLRQPVCFEAAIRQLLGEGRRLFVEVSPHPVFVTAVGETIEDALADPDEATVLATLRRDQGGSEDFARALAEAHVAGVEVEWRRHFAHAKRVKLPTYPFQRQRYWLEHAIDGGAEDPAVAAGGPGEGLAGELAALPGAEREARLLALVRGEVAKVLGKGSADSVEPNRVFKDLGFDSAAAADLRKRLRTASGLRVGATAVFDHPTASALARHLLDLASGGPASKVAVRAAATTEPVAIVGMACRLPGAASPGQLWGLLAEGGDATAEFPGDRGWDGERLFDPDPERPGTTYANRGGFLAGPGDFDAEFFEVSPREALAMDPQQRLLLEAAWEACESAGLDPGALRGTPTGVFAGVSSQDYGAGLRDAGDAAEGYRLTGSATSVASGRISYTLGLEGPAITVDTACSSSLVAIHLAAGSLRSGECSLALAGGATVMWTPDAFVLFSRQRGLAPDGRCKSFAEGADGTAWAEGAGVLVLERLSDAEANGHRVLATIRGSAVNQDGASNGLTAPNGPSQERVIRQALANAALKPADVDLIEAHGTGTALGDPIEAGALLATYGQDREEPVRLGSLKSNIGHAQAAAGVAGVIKAVMAMREGVMPKTLHLDAPSSKVEWEAGKVELLAEAMPWPETERPRRAAVSSFGISGTNAHLILEEAPVAGRDPGPGASAKDPEGEPAPLSGPLPFLVSARSEAALAAQAERLAAHLREHPASGLTDVAFSLAQTRAQMERRAVVIAAEPEELIAALDALARGERPAGALAAKAQPGSRLAYLFTGQGSQRPGMGRELYESHPAYAGALDEACAEIDPLIGRSLAQLIFSEQGSEEAELLGHTTYAQPALFALQVALYRLLESLGLTPELLAGHSVGEIAAAHVSGVFSLQDAARLICARGALMGELPAGGAMVAVEATEAELLSSLEGREAELSLAAVNSPSSCVASGSEEAIAALEAHWREAGRKTKRLEVSHAFHSPLMEPMLEPFAALTATLTYNPPQTPIVSCLTGEPLSPEQATDPAYWVAHARQPVRFAEAVSTLAAQGATSFLELGPDPVLCAMARQCLEGEGQEPILAPALRQGRAEPETLIGALAAAHVSGSSPEWSAFFAGSGARAVALPSYPFQRKRYWLAPQSGGGDFGAAGLATADHPLLGVKLESPEGDGLVLGGRLSTADQPWLADHVIFGTVLLPGTGFLELALRAASEVGAERVEELTLEAPLTFSGDRAVRLQVLVSGLDEEGRREISIHSLAEGGEEAWTRHAAGTLAHAAPAEPGMSLEAWPPPGAEPLAVDSLYEQIAERGLELGPAFHCLTAAWRDGEEIYAEVSLASGQSAEAERFGLHPVLLDAALHTTMLNAGSAAEHRELGARLPFSWRDISLGRAGADRLRVRAGFRDEWDVVVNLADAEGAPVATIESLALRPVSAEQLRGSGSAAAELSSLEWVEVPAGDSAAAPAELFELPVLAEDEAEAARGAAIATLARIKQWLASEPEDSRLALLTRAAVATSEGEAPSPAAATSWGLLRAAASEHPGRFLLIDSDGSEASAAALERALLADPRETQLALREGKLFAPRLVPAKRGRDGGVAALDPERTVLITGGTGGLGALVARHLVEAHGARHLLLVSRSGEEAPGARDLGAQLREQGAEARIAACDVADRGQLEELLDSVPGEHPLGAIVHCAGVLDDATVQTASAEQLERVFAPKVDAAWRLHELTRQLDLSHFVLFSSIAGMLGAAGQGAYAAANSFLDALATKRRAEGAVATSIAWGLWRHESGMSSELGEADVARMRRAGLEVLSERQGLALLDAALASPRPLAAAVRFDLQALRAQAATAALSPLFSKLAPAPSRRAVSSLGARLAAVPEAERAATVLELVRGEVAAVLGHDSASAVDPEKAFKELGFDSLAAVELRNRLKSSTGLRLASTAVFDHPSTASLAAHLLSETKSDGQVKRAVTRAPRSSDEPIAIVGMGCHLPGGVDSPEQLWELVAEGRDAIVPFPADRGWDLEHIYDPDPEHAGTSYVREGGFLADPASFDAEFFAIAPREAIAMDPQQRLLLETSWEALEDAGIDPRELRGEPAGVFAGAAKGDYSSAVEGYKMIGGLASILAGRVSYTLGLEGPALSVDTACSSSLVAMHLAAGALNRGECSLALAGGVTVHSTPAMFVDFSRQRVLAADGRSRSFAEEAGGAGWSEGVGMLVLERLSEAERNGRRVLATIRGSAINQDGASNGLTAPNGPAQERVIRQALAGAGLGPADVDMVEAHGTGTALGDPIEANALIATYGQDRERPLKLGSIKSNIGHTLGAAGVAGVIKATLAMRAGMMPKTLHAERPSAAIEWSSAGVELLSEPSEWERTGRPRRAAVSSFGMSGTNAHVILEQAPEPAAVEAESEDGSAPGGAVARALPGSAPLVLSAKSEPALRAQAERLARRLRERPQLDLTDVAFSLATGRASFEHRAVIAGSSRQQALEALEALAGGAGDPALILGGTGGGEARPALIFPGQGSQWEGMARELLDSSPAFAAAMDECEEALEPHIDFSLRDVLVGASGAASMDRVEVVQPALFAMMVSLARLWRACGVAPAAVAGHSQGEIAAAHIAGGLSLEDAALIVAVRSRLISTLAGQGGMVSLIAPRERVEALVEPWRETIEIAAYNGPSSTIISGAREALDELLARAAEEEGIRARPIAAGIAASHSRYIEVLRDPVLTAIAAVSPRPGSIPFYSTVSGGLLATTELGPEYWYSNMRQPVLFEQVSRGLLEAGHGVLIEVSPHPAFALSMRETIERTAADPGAATVVGTLRRDEGGPRRFVASLAQAHAAGAPVEWSAFFAGSGAREVPLPTYPFQRKRYWLNPAGGSADPAALGQRPLDHPFLAAAIEDPEGEGIAFSGRVSLSEHPWLADHAVLGTALMPGTGFLELALIAGEQAGAPTVEELTLQAPLVIPGQGATALRVTVAAAGEEGRRQIAIHSRAEGEQEGEWIRHASGVLSARAAAAPEPLPDWPPPGAEPVEPADLHARLAEAGFEYGPAFGGLTAAWRDGEETYAEVSLPAELAEAANGFSVHPALLDAVLHPIALGAGEGVRLPFSWSGASLLSAGARELRVRLSGKAEDGARIELFDGVGTPLGLVDSVVARPLDPALVRGAAKAPLYGLGWEQRAIPEAAAAPPALPWRAPEVDAGAADVAGPTLAALERVKKWLEAGPADSRLAVLTQGALAVREGESADPAQAALWGLVRSAASEHPGRFCLIDSDGSEASEQALERALGADPKETQLALREGELLVPRLLATQAEEGEAPRPLDPERTVLISGATGGLGTLIASHLVEAHGARRLLLVSRSGEWARGAAGLRTGLEELGAEIELASCDVSDRRQLEQLLAGIPDEHPLGAVIHCAAVLDDGLLESLDRERLERVFAPKAEAAWHLHELTAGLELTHFVLFSSVAGLLGSPGQANYAAANCFLDGLAALRQAAGLPATAIAWGLWKRESGMASDLDEADFARMRRAGIEALPEAQGLALFDRALASPRPLAAAARFDRAALRARAAAGALPVLLEGLAGSKARPGAASSGMFSRRLREAPEGARGRLAEDFVRTEVAAILGHASAEAVGLKDAFKDLGFDSLAAVELRNRLGAATGLQLPATVVFDYPDAEALSRKILAEISGAEVARPAPARARTSTEPIAIVGMACRYPGGVSSPAELWRLVVEERDAIAALPADRGWDTSGIYVLDPARPEVEYRREGGFLADAAGFDPGFFSISPREALSIDPQQRLALESSWEALEDAGIDPHRLRGSSTGVFAGVMHHDYGVAVDDSSGMAAGAASGRISYTLGLEGPAITVDTACSSSLVAIHLAAGALRGGECDLALAGGSTVLATPAVFGYFSRQQGLAQNGRCKSFSETADGVGVSEGAGVLVLERLSDAEANGHRVLATIRGSAVNQDGASNGLTAPNGPSQERVIRQALANAALKPADVDLIEAHGTGTALGDPIEAGALLATYGQERETPVHLGSLKSNIGHAQAAAGVAGVIKAVMAMREGVMPKTLHLDAPSSKVEWEAGKVELLSEATEWEANGAPRRAGVSSFGASGTNAHLILEEAPSGLGGGSWEEGDPAASSGASAKDPEGEPAPLSGPLPFLVSARSEAALAAQAERLAAHLREHPASGLADVAYSLATTRAQLERRAALIATEPEELIGALDALARGERPPGALLAKAQPGSRLAYLFTGQGSQRPGMGGELYESHPAYAAALEEACAEIDPLIGRSLAQLIFSEQGSEEAELLGHTTYAQPALFALQVALYRLLESLGLTPELLAGHSVGEIAAAHVSGVFSLQDAARLICARGALMGELPAGGAMVAVEATEAELLSSLEGREAELSLAAVNSPSSCVASGSEEAIAALESHWREAGRKTKRLEVSHAFHSPLMEPMLEPFAALTATLTYNPPQTPIVSCLTGEPLSPEQATDPAYWVAHARQPVRFAEAVSTLAAQGATSFLELGPDPVLCAMARQCLEGEGQEPILAPALRQGRAEPETLIGALAAAHVSGSSPEWSAFFAGSGARAVALPSYAFQRKRYWLNPAGGSADPAALGQRPLDHPFLAAAIEDPEGEGIAFGGRVSLAEHPWLADHAVLGTALMPGTGFLELALIAGEQAGAPAVEELTLQAPLVLSEQVAVALRVTLSAPDQEGCREIAIHSRPEGEEGEWTRNAAGLLGPGAAGPCEPLAQWPPPGAEPVEPADLHARLAEAGFEYGPAFGGLGAVWRDGEEVYAEVSLPAAQAEGAQGFALHPALLDAAFHPVALGAGEGVRMPFSWSGVILFSSGAGELRVRLSGGGEESAGLEIFDAVGTPVGRVESVVGRPLDPAQLRVATPPLYSLGWQRRPLAGRASPPAEPWRAPARAPGVAAAREVTAAALEKIQRWLASEPEDARLAILTQGAVATSEGEAVDAAQAALWGLIRCAASEHPGRFQLIDSDGSEASEAALRQALAAEEPQLALREGASFVPRLAAAKEGEGDPSAPLDPERTVLITGGTGGLGALVASHLVEAHGARHLLLISRSGEEAPGARDLGAKLRELGAEARIAACDVADRGQLEELLDSVPGEHPLGAVIHCAGVLDDATIAAADPQQLERVFAPKADAAWHLHELTAGLDLSHFVLFSSIAGLLGSPGQGAYAAANCFLDGLAAQRRGQGAPATAIAWGLWARESGMASKLGEAEMARMRRAGIGALAEQEGFALFDRALAGPLPLVAAVRFDRAALRAQAAAAGPSPLLEGMAPAGGGAAAAATGALSRRLREAPEGARGRLAEDFVRAEVAAILGHASAAAIGPNDAFKDLGFDSLAAIELRNRLGAAVDRRLAASVVFDYPTAAALAAHLLEEAGGAGSAPAPGLGQLEQALAALSADDPARAELAGRLRALAAELDGDGGASGGSVADRLEAASDQELLDFIDTQVGPSRG